MSECGKEHRHSDSEDSTNDGEVKLTKEERRRKPGSRAEQLQMWLKANQLSDYGPRLHDYGVEVWRDVELMKPDEVAMLKRDIEIVNVRKVRGS